MRPSRSGRALAGLAWVAALLGAVAVLIVAGTGPLATPPLSDVQALRRWLDDRDAVVAAFALLRLVGLALAGYLLVVTALGLAARLSRMPALVAAIDVATVPAVRRVLGAVAGVSLTASVVSTGGSEAVVRPSARAEVGADAPVTLRRLGDPAEVILRPVPSGTSPVTSAGRLTMQVEPDAPTPAVGDGTVTMRVDDGRHGDAGPEWVVRPGDHLWSIAEAALARAWDRPPSEDEVAPYWRAVVEANRDRLVHRDDPDLIRPGQVLTLPPLPPARSG